MQIAQNIKRAKQTHNFTNAYLGYATETSRRTIGRLLKKAENPGFNYMPSQQTKYKICRFFAADATKRLPKFQIELVG